MNFKDPRTAVRAITANGDIDKLTMTVYWVEGKPSFSHWPFMKLGAIAPAFWRVHRMARHFSYAKIQGLS